MTAPMTEPPTTIRVDRTAYRIHDSAVERQVNGTWTAVPLRRLRDDYDVDSPLWVWLRSHGFRRPSPSGPSGTKWSEQDYAAAGYDKSWHLRPRAGTIAMYGELARIWRCSPVDAVERAGREALAKEKK